jgi:gamma-glutamyltranspeptidase/glutathione hydrolase
MRSKIYALVFSLFLLSFGCRKSIPLSYQIEKTAISDQGMVVSAHPLATQAGVEILEMGGSAVDAAIAIQLSLAVVHPRAGNIGGGGFLVHRLADGTISSLDYREMAPAQAERDMYLDDSKNVIAGLSTKGHLASGVPGTIDGLFTMHEKFGKLPMENLFVPAIRYAKQGHGITQSEADRLNRFKDAFLEFNNTSIPFIKDTPWNAGDHLLQKTLAQTLERIQKNGRDGFYRGPTADAIVEEMKSGRGIITHKDLEGYRAKWRDPITTEYKEYTLISMPPSSSGGIVLAQMLEMIEPYPINDWGFQDARTMHLMVEAERRAYADRAAFLGDMDHYHVPLDSLMQPHYLTFRMSDFSLDTATESSYVQAGDFNVALESYETTHLSVVDKDGNAASVTTTLNSNYGSKVYVDGAGFFLNNEMDDFSAKPGVMNQFGLLGAEANAIAPGKRMLSSMTPTIVEKNDDLFMIVGTPGGSTIMTSVFQVFLNVAEFEMTMTESVHAKRFHHQWLPDEIVYEKNGLDTNTMMVLEEMGHSFRAVDYIGKVEAILKRSDGQYEGAADNRGDDHAQGPGK